MNPSNTLRVIAVDEARVPRRDELDRIQPDRFVGRNAAGDPEAEDVPDAVYVRRAIRRGDLREVPEDAPLQAPATPSTPPTEP